MSERDYVINGECMVQVKGGKDTDIEFLKELGLASEGVRIAPRFYHDPLRADDFGPHVAPEMLFQLADCDITMTLIHWDPAILDVCVHESMGGFNEPGVVAAAGLPMGGGKPIFGKGNHYISLNLASPMLQRPWRFPASYLAEQPFELPIGTKASLLMLRWRAIPYRSFTGVIIGSGSTLVNEIISENTTLWERTLDDGAVSGISTSGWLRSGGQG